MVEFACEDRQVEAAFRTLCEQVTQHGGLIYDRLTMGCRNGDFIISAPQDKPAGEKILIIPKDILLPVARYHIAVEGDDMVITTPDPGLSRGQIAIMESMLALFNLTGKMKQLRQHSVLGLLRSDPAFFEAIAARQGSGGKPYYESMKESGDSDFWLEAFMKTRVLGFKDRPDDKQSERVQMLMPVVDFINHHPQAYGFFTSFRTIDKRPPPPSPGGQENIEAQGADGVAVMNACPVPGSQECFVNYGAFDAADTFVNYNFVERNAAFVRSVSMTVKIPGVGTLNINSFAVRPEFTKLPEQVRDLRFFLPAIQADPRNRTVTLSSLLIPQDPAPRALRRVLAIALSRIGLTLDESILSDAVRHAERVVIAENERYYTDLLAFLDSRKPAAATKHIAAMAREMAELQLKRIALYPFYAEAGGGNDARAQPKKPGRKARASS